MERNFSERTITLLGKEKFTKLQSAHVAVFGLGGVGSYALEALVRAGIGTITIVDFDQIEESNINRQILATYPDIGRHKVDIAEERMLKINPEVTIHKFSTFVNSENILEIIKKDFHFAIDAIDTLHSKIDLLVSLYKEKIFTVACMGAGMKVDPSSITIRDISKTHTCPLAKNVRVELKKRGIINGITCVFSTETPKQIYINNDFNKNTTIHSDAKKQAIGSISYIPGIFGLTSAGIIIQKIISQ
ncbi:MAG: tRNA threonylcarbamoyladenosine dehydratase [Candidatus Hydrogenedens sp.]